MTTIHAHFASTADAYDASQCVDTIESGDILVIESEGVVAILDKAWPAAITVAHGEMHTWNKPALKVRDGAYRESFAVAFGMARALGFEVNPLHVPGYVAPPPKPEPEPAPEPEILDERGNCVACDGWGWIDIFHPSTDGLIGSRDCPLKQNHPPREPIPAQALAVKHLEGCDGEGHTLDACCPPF